MERETRRVTDGNHGEETKIKIQKQKEDPNKKKSKISAT